MLALVLTVCLIDTPTDCHTERLMYSDVAKIVCDIHWQEQAAIWVQDNPGYRVTRGECDDSAVKYDPA